jgi:hypothetical protein
MGDPVGAGFPRPYGITQPIANGRSKTIAMIQCDRHNGNCTMGILGRSIWIWLRAGKARPYGGMSITDRCLDRCIAELRRLIG